jgi:hypothetical protein
MAVLSVPAMMTGVVFYLVDALFSNLALSCLAAILVLSCRKNSKKKTKSAQCTGVINNVYKTYCKQPQAGVSQSIVYNKCYPNSYLFSR